MYIFLFIIIFLLGFWIFRKFFKTPRFSALTMITGGVKSGKSALTVSFAVREYKRAKRRYYFRYAVSKVLRRKKPEKPLLYSNIPLRKLDFVPLTDKILLRHERMAFGSIVILDEASLVADSQLVKNKKVNIQLMLFFKLFGHETHGGKCFVNSHCLSDLHYAIKRTTSTYYYVHHLSKFPFFSSFKLREERYSDDGSVVNTYSEDVDKSLLRVFMLNRTYKRYDAYCYSILTDKLPVSDKVRYIAKFSNLKSKDIVSFREELRDLTAFAPRSNILSSSEVNTDA